MAEFYRFRSMKYLLGEEYQELENQTIYFASPEQLNDPMEGLRDIVWTGDEIVWTNLFKHYIYCLNNVYYLVRTGGYSEEYGVDIIPILGRWDELPSSREKQLFDDVWERFLSIPKIPKVIETIANAKYKIRYNQIACYFRVIHALLLAIIKKSYITNGLGSDFDTPQLPEELYGTVLIEGLLAWTKIDGEADNEAQLEAAFLDGEVIDNNERVKQQYGTRTISTGILAKYNQLVSYDFPKVYLKQLERLLWPKWYTACFMKSYHNSSVWGNYADNHRGACLIFAVDADKSKSLKLKPVKNKQAETMPFHGVRYAKKAGEVDFFRSLGRLPVPVLMQLWYTDSDGNKSECAAHIQPDGEKKEDWRESYWDNFYRDITIKTKDWEYEQEYRLILNDRWREHEGKNYRTYTYNFSSLKGIILGIKISDENRLRIIETIERKCRDHNRTDFKLFQAYYSLEHGDIRKYEIQLPFRLCPLPDASDIVPEAEEAYRLGNFLLALNQKDHAIEAYSRAIELNPDYREAYEKRGAVYYSQGNRGRALKDFSIIIQLNPDFDIAVFTDSIAVNPNSAEVYFYRGSAYARKGKFARAIEDYTKAIDLNPGYTTAYSNRGRAYRRQRDYDRAVVDFNKAISLNPNYAEAYCGRGVVYSNKGNYDCAIGDHTKAITLKPNYVNAYLNRGVAYRDKADYVRAIKDFTKANELDYDDARPYLNRGLVRLCREEWKNAKSDLMIAEDKGVDIVASFCKTYESAENFEQKNNVKIPEDIAAMLTQRQTES